MTEADIGEKAHEWNERKASLCGLAASLALPPVRCADGSYRSRVVEVEITANAWVRVASIVVEGYRVTFVSAIGAEYVFANGEMPAWRIEQ